ncbi:hypothetical protein IE53DRAFT_133460 [Violaceomyces palustris]|uniref:Uncharacterized protein n=1 Tax=Violaceomyces palustris TaxID=1673888 RepID=A0ACD0NV42_9BASI|nr:hypothetical protein IE53DRAFT_133460 [Violaceomyces palustris]
MTVRRCDYEDEMGWSGCEERWLNWDRMDLFTPSLLIRILIRIEEKPADPLAPHPPAETRLIDRPLLRLAFSSLPHLAQLAARRHSPFYRVCLYALVCKQARVERVEEGAKRDAERVREERG